MKPRRWQVGLMIGTGAWLVCGPFWMPRYDQAGSAAVWHSCAVGALILLLAFIKIARPKLWQDWSGLAIGAWLIIAPSVLGFGSITGVATSNHMIAGLVIGLLALGLLALSERRSTVDSR